LLTYRNLIVSNMPSKIYDVPPLLEAEDLERSKTWSAASDASGSSDFVWIEADGFKEWTDEQLKDDARPGRRKGKHNQITVMTERVSDENDQNLEKELIRKDSAEGEE
jgi:hypothetical protein